MELINSVQPSNDYQDVIEEEMMEDESDKDEQSEPEENFLDEKEGMIVEEKKVTKKRRRGPSLGELIPLNLKSEKEKFYT